MAEVSADIVGKGDDHEDAIDNGDDVHSLTCDIGEQDHHCQTYKQNGGTDFAGDQRAGEHTALAEGHQTGKELETLLDHKQNHQMPEDGVLDAQADDQRELGHLVGNGIENFADGGDHVVLAGDFSVYQIGQTRDSQNDGCGNIVFCLGSIEVDGHIDRDQQQTEQTKKIRNRKYFFFPILDHEYILLPR